MGERRFIPLNHLNPGQRHAKRHSMPFAYAAAQRGRAGVAGRRVWVEKSRKFSKGSPKDTSRRHKVCLDCYRKILPLLHIYDSKYLFCPCLLACCAPLVGRSRREFCPSLYICKRKNGLRSSISKPKPAYITVVSSANPHATRNALSRHCQLSLA